MARRSAHHRLVVLALLALVAAALPQARGDARRANLSAAEALFNRALAHYRLGEFAPALSLFRESYRVSAVPELLINIAQCHRGLGQRAEAIRLLRVYLIDGRDQAKRAEVAGLITVLEREQAAAPAAAPESPDPPPAVTPPTPPVSAPAPVIVAPAPIAAPPSLTDAHPRPPVRRPLHRRWWFWTSLVGGAAVVGGAIALGVVYGRRSSSSADGPILPLPEPRL